MIVAVVAVVRVLVWAAAIIDTVLLVKVLVIDVLADVEIIVVGVMVIVDVDLFMDASAGVMLGGLTEIGNEVLPDVSANAFAVAMAASEFSR